jgi:hypothetical protein
MIKEDRQCYVTDVSLHCPEIHTYSHTQQFPGIICVIPGVERARNF